MTKSKSSLEALEPLFEKVGQLTKLHRLLICAGALVLLVGGFFYYSFLPKIEQVNQLRDRKSSLEGQLSIAKRKAAQLQKFRALMKKAEDDFMIAKAVLPEKREIPALLTNISQSGTDAGLDFLLFQPKREVKKGFYTEIPVSIRVSGSYHNVATFFDNVSRLYRIVNIEDIQMKSGKSEAMLNTSCTAVTYKFVEANKKKSNGKRQKR